MLETVARKYVKLYCCKNLYIDRKSIIKEKKRVHEEKKRELEEQESMKKEDIKTNNSNNNEDDDSSDNSVFANLKNYSKEKQSSTSSNNKRNRSKSDEMLHVSERANKFVRRGTIQEFELTQKKEYSVVDTRPKLDFETFKRLFAQSQESNSVNNDDTDNTVQNKKGD